MRLVVGRIVRPHGVRGEVVVEPRTDRVDERFAPGQVLHAGRPATLTIRGARPHGGRLLVRFNGIVDRAAAESLRGVNLSVDDSGVSEDPDVFPDAALIGLDVRDSGGASIGTVSGVEHRPMQDLLVVDVGSAAPALVPFVAAIVPTVDIPGGWLQVDAPDGLLDADAEA